MGVGRVGEREKVGGGGRIRLGVGGEDGEEEGEKGGGNRTPPPPPSL